METRTLATLRVPRHHQFGRCWIFDHIGNALTNTFHVFEVNSLKFEGLFVVLGQLTSINPVHLGPLIVDHVDSGLRTRHCLSEVASTFGLPTWLQRLEPFWIGRFVVANTNTCGSALEDEKFFRGFSQFWYNLNCRCTSTDNAHSLISKFLHQCLRTSTGVAVIPATGVEGTTCVGFNTRDARQLGLMKNSTGNHDELCRENVAARGHDIPALP